MAKLIAIQPASSSVVEESQVAKISFDIAMRNLVAKLSEHCGGNVIVLSPQRTSTVADITAQRLKGKAEVVVQLDHDPSIPENVEIAWALVSAALATHDVVIMVAPRMNCALASRYHDERRGSCRSFDDREGYYAIVLNEEHSPIIVA
jgi:hypothetical protein